MDITQFSLTWDGWPNGEKLALTCVQIYFDLDQSERKSSQVNASARKSWPNGFERRPNLRLLATPFGLEGSESFLRGDTVQPLYNGHLRDRRLVRTYFTEM